MLVADLLVRCLEEEGVNYVFGVPAAENTPFLRALEKSSTIKFILTRHEQSAIFMADVYGRLTGKIAVCLSSAGPDTTNMLTGITNANIDCVPLLVVIGQAAQTHHDALPMFQSVTKWSHSVQHPDSVPAVVRQAMRTALIEKPGPCIIELADNIAALSTTAQPIPKKNSSQAVADNSTVESLYQRLKTAKNPVVLAGHAFIRAQATEQLRQLCALTNIGVISCFMAKGCVDKDADYCLFTIGLQANDFPNSVLDSADLVICLGFDSAEHPPRLWNAKKSKAIIHVGNLPATINEHYHPELEVIGNIKQTLVTLTTLIQQQAPLSFDLKQQVTARKEMLKDLTKYNDDKTSGLVRPQKMLSDARQVLGPADILISDMSTNQLWVARFFHCHLPNTCIIPSGFSALGYALPAAISAALTYPERRILAITDDCGFLVNLQEMETAKRLNSNIVVVIWENKESGAVRWAQETPTSQESRLSLNNPDWMQLAKAFSWHSHRIAESEQLLGALLVAFQEQGPSMIVIPIDYRENVKLIKRFGSLLSNV